MNLILKRHLGVFILLVFFLPELFYGQNTPSSNGKLAIQYFEQKEFEKANVYLEDLYDKNPNAWFVYYYKSLIAVKDYTKAEKITKKQLKRNKQDVHLYVYLGRIYKLQEEYKKEKEAYEKAIQEVEPIQPNIDNLVEVFKEDKLYDQALAVYAKARKANSDYPYYYERAELFKSKGDFTAMINELLDALEFRESELQTVQMVLQNSLGYDDNEGGMKNPILKQELQKRIQKHPDKTVLSEFLIFLQKQQKDFDGAFVQSRALDKRLKEDGQRIYELAKICISNKSYEPAKRCLNYLVEKGSDNVFYDAAIIEGLNLDYILITQKAQPATSDLMALEQSLDKAYLKYRSYPTAAQLLKNLCNLKAYYLNKSDEAVTLLEEYIRQPEISAQSKAEYKLMLADIYLIKGEIWDASLLYSQVEKEFKYETIGQEAKFRNAKLSFYAGDFAWAKTQADVLKGATSKLIANDALDLSLIITDAIGVDTNDLPLKMYASAELMILQHKYDQAIARLDSINNLFSNNTLGDDIYFKKAQIYFILGNYTEVEAMYKNILDYYPSDLYGDDAQFNLAQLYELNLLNKEKAKQTYEELLTKYPGSIFTVEARNRYRMLRGDNLNN